MWMWLCKLNKPFPPQAAFGHGVYFITAIETLTQHKAGAEAELKVQPISQEKCDRTK